MSVSYLMFVKCLEDEKQIRKTNYNHYNEGSRLQEITRQTARSATQFVQREGSECFYPHHAYNLV